LSKERSIVEPVAPSTPEPIKPERTSSNFSLFLSIAVLIAVVALFIQSNQLQKLAKKFLGSPTVSASAMPSTLLSRDALYISEVLTDDRAEQEEIDQAFDAFSGRSGGLAFNVLSLWDVYSYLVVEKYRSQYYSFFFSNSPPVWRTDEKTKKQELYIAGLQFWVTTWNEKTNEGNKHWPSYSYFANMVKVGVIVSCPENIPPKECWVRFINTKDFRIASYGEKYPSTDTNRVTDARFFGGKYPSGKKTIYTQIFP